jgi:hypothetical protein
MNKITSYGGAKIMSTPIRLPVLKKAGGGTSYKWQTAKPSGRSRNIPRWAQCKTPSQHLTNIPRHSNS